MDQKYGDLLDMHFLEGPIGSTQDESKRLLLEMESDNCTTIRDTPKDPLALVVVAKEQINGRGTQGRTWEGTKGNVYLTIAVPLHRIPVTITLLPLKIGGLIAQTIQTFLSSNRTGEATTHQRKDHKIVVKWPNDVLLDGGKMAGVLIENWSSPKKNVSSWFLIGIGINVAFAPSLPSDVRTAACLQDYSTVMLDETASQTMALTLVDQFVTWILNNHHAEDKAMLEASILQEFRSWTEFHRDYKIRETGEQVTTLDVLPDGQLRVRGANGQERTLVADYLF